MESLTGFSQVPSTQPPPPAPSSNSVSPHLTIESLCCVAYPVVYLLDPSKNRKGNSKPPLPGNDPDRRV